MNNEQIMMLSQIVSSLQEASVNFEVAYKANDKKKFEKAKQAILDFQNKINILLKEKN